MSRAALLPTPGNNPFLVAYWLKHYESWKDQVDTLYVDVSWPVDSRISERITADAEAVGAKVTVCPPGPLRTHGLALEHMLSFVREEFVMFIEDDMYVRRPAAIGEAFAKVERGEYDIVGEARACMSNELFDVCQERFGTGQAGAWPGLVFARANTFRDAGGLDSEGWAAGEVVPGLDRTFDVDTCADTFTAGMIRLRSMGYRFGEHPEKFRLDDHSPDWFHVGSLSSGPIYGGARDVVLHHARNSGDSYSRRCAWWGKMLDHWPGGLDEFRAEYEHDLNETAEAVGLGWVERERAKFDRLVAWPE